MVRLKIKNVIRKKMYVIGVSETSFLKHIFLVIINSPLPQKLEIVHESPEVCHINVLTVDP